MKRLYICEYCGKQFENDETRCYIHEENCELKPEHWTIIKVTCKSACPDRLWTMCNNCRNDDWCVNTVLIPTSDIENIKANEPYDYTNNGHDDGFVCRLYTSTNGSNYTFRAKCR